MRLNLNLLTQNLFDFIFPSNCLGCGKPGSFACAQCLKNVQAPRQMCIVCRKFEPCGITHSNCRNRFSPSQLFCAANFHDLFPRQLIHTFKFELIKELGLPCSQVIAEFLKIQKFKTNSSWMITYVPMHTYRQSLRGFNQAKVLAEWLSESLQIEAADLLKKPRQTKSQAKLNQENREKNLSGVFEITGVPLKNRRVLLIDDVCTTGSTLRECTKVLLEAGAKEVQCATFAREP